MKDITNEEIAEIRAFGKKATEGFYNLLDNCDASGDDIKVLMIADFAVHMLAVFIVNTAANLNNPTEEILNLHISKTNEQSLKKAHKFARMHGLDDEAGLIKKLIPEGFKQ